MPFRAASAGQCDRVPPRALVASTADGPDVQRPQGRDRRIGDVDHRASIGRPMTHVTRRRRTDVANASYVCEYPSRRPPQRDVLNKENPPCTAVPSPPVRPPRSHALPGRRPTSSAAQRRSGCARCVAGPRGRSTDDADEHTARRSIRASPPSDRGGRMQRRAAWSASSWASPRAGTAPVSAAPRRTHLRAACRYDRSKATTRAPHRAEW